MNTPAGLVAALLTAKLMFKGDLTMALHGAGLVVTAEPTPHGPVIGAIGGRFGVLNSHIRQVKNRCPVGAISVHGTVGIWGLQRSVLLIPMQLLVRKLWVLSPFSPGLSDGYGYQSK